MEAATFTPLAAALAPEGRVVALDQRGHGDSDHAASYARDDTRLEILDGGHVVHLDNPTAFAHATREFLKELSSPRPVVS